MYIGETVRTFTAEPVWTPVPAKPDALPDADQPDGPEDAATQAVPAT